MKVQIFWGNVEKTIIQIDMNVGWQWDDLYATFTPYLEMMNSVDHRVSLIFNVKEENIRENALSNLSRLIRMTHPREDKTVIVGHIPLITPFLDILSKVYGLKALLQNYRTAKTLEEAYTMLGSQPAPLAPVDEKTEINDAT